MNKLIVDIGNSRTKIALFGENGILEIFTSKTNLSKALSVINEKYGTPVSCIISSVKSDIGKPLDRLSFFGIQKIVTIRSGIRLPVKIFYKTPETLGTDRLANVCAAPEIYPNFDILVIDAGTCIKYDFLDKENKYHGGSISPGLKMRYKALSSFTGQLPYFKSKDDFPELTGNSTETSIRSGVENGMLEEINGIINRYREQSNSIKIILTGGDHTRFADKLKSPIFVAPNLTLNGLKVILDHNDL